MFTIINVFSALSFVGFGISCLFSAHMAREFERYRLVRFRTLTGVLQLMAAAGLVAGLRFPVIGALAAGGLAIQMLVGFCVRRKFRDNLLQSIPALAYCVINTWLLIQFADQLSAG